MNALASTGWATSRPATSSPRWCAPSRQGGLSLDESVALWERGEALARRCEEQLAGARDRVQAVLDAAPGTGTEQA